MPELPEVETIRRDLSRLAVGRAVLSVEVLWPGSIKGPASEFSRSLTGRGFTGFSRRAKILIAEVDSGERFMAHLKMSGRLVFVPSDEPVHKHTRLIFRLDNDHDLRFIDMRKFGYLKLIGPAGSFVPELERFGPEPLDPAFTLAAWRALKASRNGSRRPFKALLLDQSFIAGLGNIYVDESLYAARIRPERMAASLNGSDEKRLYNAVREVLRAAIEDRGTTFDLYVDGEGRRGGHAQNLMVYGRAGEPCLSCGSPIQKTRVAGRGTHFCPHCQK